LAPFLLNSGGENMTNEKAKTKCIDSAVGVLTAVAAGVTAIAAAPKAGEVIGEAYNWVRGKK
jgi:hypothetical protein